MPYLERDGAPDIHYDLDGQPPGERTGVVFFNGMTQTTEHWAGQAKMFGEDFPVLRYDARGHGETTLGDHPVSMELHVEDVLQLLDHLDWSSAHFVGFSHGSRVALAAATRDAGRVDRLVLCSSTARPTAVARTIIRSWREVLESGGLEAMSWAALPSIIGNDYLDQNEQILEGIVRASVGRNREEDVRALLDAHADYPEQAELAEQLDDIPTLVISAEEDPLVDREGARKLADIAGGEHRHLDGVGHTVAIEAPETFHEVVDDFLE
ncbi:MAG: alpha/beta fold hydrolase [Bradymonadaceae bacterium]